MKLLKFLYIIAIAVAISSCAAVNDIMESGGIRIIGEWATDGYIRSMTRNGADSEQIQQMRDLSDNIFGPNRIDRIQAWNEANTVDKVRSVSRDFFTVLSNTKKMSDRQELMQVLVNMIDSTANSINALSDARSGSDRTKIIANTIFDLGSMRSEYATSFENVNRKFSKMCRQDPSLEEEYEVAEVEFIYEAEYDDDGNLTGRINRIPAKWAIVKKKSEWFDGAIVETFIMEDELNERKAIYWASLRPDSNTHVVIPSEENAFINKSAETNTVTDTPLELQNKAISKINETYIDRYEFDATELNYTQQIELSAIALLLNDFPNLSICLTGHTCNIGADNVNYRKGLKRAETVKAYLEEQGIPAERISVESAGATAPLVPNNSIENRKLNRRVTFLVK